MIDILAHRATLNSAENSINGISNCIELDIGVEIDLRLGKDGIYMSHELKTRGELFENACRILSDSKITIALHIKEISVVKETLRLIKKYSLKNYFLFNTNYKKILGITNNHHLGFYASKEPKKIKERILWCDEVKEKWYNYELISNLHKQKKILYAMSKEVVMNCKKNEIYNEWKRLIELNMDGICTKYPKELLKFLKQGEYC